jgi:hypothetical protein
MVVGGGTEQYHTPDLADVASEPVIEPTGNTCLLALT